MADDVRSTERHATVIRCDDFRAFTPVRNVRLCEIPIDDGNFPVREKERLRALHMAARWGDELRRYPRLSSIVAVGLDEWRRAVRVGEVGKERERYEDATGRRWPAVERVDRHPVLVREVV